MAGPFIRPLLEVDRQMISDYATAHGIAYREDSSNRDPKYLRNRVRHELLPLIQQLRPGSHASLRRSSALLREMVGIVIGQLDREAGKEIRVERVLPLDRLRGSAHPRLFLLHVHHGLDLHPDVIEQLHRAIRGRTVSVRSSARTRAPCGSPAIC
jgi:tRNA(Ile)-lysidine synthase